MSDDVELSYFVPVLSFSEGAWIDGNKKWIKVVPYDSWDHPYFGETTVTKADAEAMKQKFDARVLGIDVHIDYEHGLDPAKGTKASGKYNALDVRDDGLWGLVEFTPTAVAEIDNREWNYFSPQFNDNKHTYEHPHTGETLSWLLRGGGLTNKPWIKGMPPLNFSELAVTATAAEYTEHMKDMALLQGEILRGKIFSTEYVDALPDAAFLYVDKDGKRHFPVKDDKGHVALGLVKMFSEGLVLSDISPDDEVYNRLKTTATRLLDTSIKLSEAAVLERDETQLYEPAFVPLTPETPYEKVQRSDGVLIVVDEQAEKYFREPGVDADVPEVNRDDAADDGWRRETPPAGDDGSIETPNFSALHSNEGGSTVDEAKLREVLGIDADTDIIEHATKLKTDADAVASLRATTDASKTFSEQYPDQHAEIERLREINRVGEAKAFSEAFAGKRLAIDTGEKNDDEDKTPKLELTGYGLSALATQKLNDLYLSFSEGAATPAKLRETMDGIFDGGLVEYKTRGSSIEPPEDDAITPTDKTGVAKAFSDKIMETMTKDSLDYEAAMKVVATANPDLADAWLASSASSR